MSRIKTRILILSDTHAHSPASTGADEDLSASSDFAVATTGYRAPLPVADVALHCGDLTTHSFPWEFRQTVAMLRGLRAPLKIVIPGNHDGALDAAYWTPLPEEDHGEWSMPKDHAYRTEALELLDEAKADGVVYLGEEGVHTFPLANGAVLRLFVSPYTPAYGVWGFQYAPDAGHTFAIPAGIDVAMTHGPPRDVLDLAGFDLPQHGMTRTHAGCPDLFAAVAAARPRVHCFGHIHESWGAYLARWKAPAAAAGAPATTEDTHRTATADDTIDAASSRNIVTLPEVKPMTVLDPPATAAQAARLMEWSRQMGVHVDLEEARGEARGEEDGGAGEHTLFINAAIQGFMQLPSQLPFIIDMMLDKAAS